MADSTPKGTVEHEASAPDADALLDRFLDDSDEHPAKDEGEPEQADDAEVQAEAEEADTDSEDNAEAEESDQSQEASAGRFVGDDGKVRLADGTVITVAELKRGNLREADYTRKTQEHSALRKELEARQAALAQHEQSINFAMEVAQAYLPLKPDPTLLHSDPLGYLQAKEDYEARMLQIQQLYTAKQENERAQAEQRQADFRRQMEEGRDALLNAIPELKEPAKLNAFSTDLSKAISKYGFDPNDIGQVKDYRLFLMAKDAMAYQKLMASKPQAMAKTAGKPPIAPGRRLSPQADKNRQKETDWQKLRQSHGKDQGALDRILDDLI